MANSNTSKGDDFGSKSSGLSDAKDGKHKHLTPFEYVTPKNFEENVKRDALELKHVRAYAVGHLSNDLCAAAWFTYVLFYLQEVVKIG